MPRWVSACLDDGTPPDGAFPLEPAEAEGVLPWLAYRLQDSGALSGMPAPQQEELRRALRRWNLMHLDCEAELERLVRSADACGLRLLAFKGHSVARTLYPHPACRPTSDFDLLIDPLQVDLARQWIASLAYEPADPFAGPVWLGQQAWWLSVGGKTRFAADLHWDYSNRMYFRRRLAFGDIWAATREVPCGDGMLRVPCRVDDVIFACVHLAAFDPGLHVRLVWLLDVYLLLAALGEAEIDSLLERAGRARAIEACLACGQMAAALGDAGRLQPALEALAQAGSGRRARAYQRTLRWRGWDLACYWGRLGWADKVHFWGDVARWVRVRSYTNTRGSPAGT